MTNPTMDAIQPPNAGESTGPNGVHVVKRTSRRGFSSETLPRPIVERIESAFRGPWWIDGWSRRAFHDAADTIRRETASCGLILLGRTIRLGVPPPFDAPFEPIELGSRDPRMKALSGDTPTREERQNPWILGIGATIAVILLIIFGVAVLRGLPLIAVWVILSSIAFAALIAVAAVALRGMWVKWYLVPGGVAVIRSYGKPESRRILRTRLDSCLVLRHVSNGKATFLMAEIWWHGRGRIRRAVSEREAITLIAAWQSLRTPPTIEQIAELM